MSPAEPSSPDGDPRDAPGSDVPALRVLLVENHSDTRQGVQIFLRLLGHQVSCAENVAQTMALAARERFDVLVSDITLPDGDGWDLLAQLAALGTRPAHAVAMSGLGSPADQQRSREAGFAMHLVKPFAPEQLAEALGRITGREVMGAPPCRASSPPGPGAAWRQRMHDGLCQHLVAASFLQEALIRRLETMAPPDGDGSKPTLALREAVASARQVSQLLDEALTESRALMRGV